MSKLDETKIDLVPGRRHQITEESFVRLRQKDYPGWGKTRSGDVYCVRLSILDPGGTKTEDYYAKFMDPIASGYFCVAGLPKANRNKYAVYTAFFYFQMYDDARYFLDKFYGEANNDF